MTRMHSMEQTEYTLHLEKTYETQAKQLKARKSNQLNLA